LGQIKGLKVAARVVSHDSRPVVTHLLQAELKDGKAVTLLKLNSKKQAQKYLLALREQICLEHSGCWRFRNWQLPSSVKGVADWRP
jgi:hypothetical protein